MFASKVVNTSAVLLMLALLVSCGKKEEPKTVAPTPTAAAPAPPQAPPAATSATAPTPPAAAPAVAAGPAPIATTDGEQPGLRVEVRTLKRDGSATVTLQFTVINDSDAEFSARTQLGATSHGNDDYETVSGVQLIDPVNKKKYLVVRDAENKCVCSNGVYAVAAKSRSNLWAKFPAPPDDVKKITVIVPHFVPMDDVPIGG